MNRRAHDLLRRPRITSPVPWHQNVTVELAVTNTLAERPRPRMLAMGTSPGTDLGVELFATRQRTALAGLPSPDEAVKRTSRPSFRCSDDEDPEHETDDTLPFDLELPEP